MFKSKGLSLSLSHFANCVSSQLMLCIYVSPINFLMYASVLRNVTRFAAFILVKLFAQGGDILMLSFEKGEVKDYKIYHQGRSKITAVIKGYRVIGTIPSPKGCTQLSSEVEHAHVWHSVFVSFSATSH